MEEEEEKIGQSILDYILWVGWRGGIETKSPTNGCFWSDSLSEKKLDEKEEQEEEENGGSILDFKMIGS